MRDRVKVDRCVLDSILWFHVECPKQVAKFDNPNTFRRKFRDMFADLKSGLHVIVDQDSEEKRIEAAYNFNPYPEDIKEKTELRRFEEEFRPFNPVLYMEPEDEYENEPLGEEEQVVDDENELGYGKIPDYMKT